MLICQKKNLSLFFLSYQLKNLFKHEFLFLFARGKKMSSQAHIAATARSYLWLSWSSRTTLSGTISYFLSPSAQHSLARWPRDPQREHVVGSSAPNSIGFLPSCGVRLRCAAISAFTLFGSKSVPSPCRTYL